MSEINTSNESKETDRPVSENPFSGHLKMYPKLYQQACILAATEPKPGDSRSELLKRIIITLDVVTKMIFGQDQANKAQLVLYGGGALELLVDLVRRSEVLDTTSCKSLLDDQERTLLLTAVKGIKICVLRNAPGRARVRISGALDTLSGSVNLCFQQQQNDALLMEEILTTCAAVCLGDDLNALQVRSLGYPFLLFFLIVSNDFKRSMFRLKSRHLSFSESLFVKLKNFIQLKQTHLCIKRFCT
jgi:hypothetical protein